MQKNRTNIMAEKPPLLILMNRGLGQGIEVGDNDQMYVNIEIIGQDIQPDENGNEIMKHTLKVTSAKKITKKVARIE